MIKALIAGKYLMIVAVIALGLFVLPYTTLAQSAGSQFDTTDGRSGGRNFGSTPANAQTIGEQYSDIADQGIIFAGICDGRYAPCDCRDQGLCTLEDVLQVLVNVSVFILGISGSILLLVFFYGGFMWITAHGNPNMIESGKKAIVGGVVGLVIIFGAYVAITLLVSVLQTGNVVESGQNLEDVIENGDAVIETTNP